MTRTLSIHLAGLFLLCIAAGAAAQQQSGITPALSGEQFRISFKNADLTALIATVSELTGKSFVVDPRVKGQITVLSSKPMTAEELYQTFLSVLEVHGYAAVPAGAVTKIVPQIIAKKEGGFGGNIETPEDIVTRVIQVSNVPAAQLVPILRPLVPQYGHLAAYPASNILIISDRKANVKRIQRIVERIDKEGNRQVEIIPLENAPATEVVQILRQLKADAKKANPNGASFTVVAAERTNSVILAAPPKMELRLRAIIADLDTPVKDEGGTHVVYLDYADAKELAEMLQQYAAHLPDSGKKDPRRRGANAVSVLPAEGANALVISGPPAAMREIREVIEKLDVPRGQVLIEALIVEVSLNQARELGINLAAFEDGAGVAASILDKNTLQALPALASGGLPLNLIQQGLNIAFGGSSGDDVFGALIRAFSGNSRTNVLSTPTLVTLDNEKAKIMVGQVVPFVTGSFTTGVTGTGGQPGTGLVNPFQTIERKDVGLSLKITPQINAGETVQLEIDLEISSIAQSSRGAADLITNKRSISTTVAVESGNILVLGGLISTQLQESTQKVPILSEIPLLGALFRSHSVTRRKRNLLNFIRPTILRGGSAAQYYTRQKYRYMRNLQQSLDSPVPLMPDVQRPTLPPLERYLHTPVFPQNAGGDGTPAERQRSQQQRPTQSTPASQRAEYNR